MATGKRKKRNAFKPAIKDYRNGFERGIAKRLMIAEVPFKYEHERLPYILNGKVHHYTPDFMIGDDLIIEGKGLFGHFGPLEACQRERHKLILVKDQHPERDIRIVFQDAQWITKDGSMTYAQWADDHGFQWSDDGVVPEEWVVDIKQKMATQ